MIYNLKQTYSGFSAEYTLKFDDNTTYSVQVELNKILIFKNNIHLYTIFQKKIFNISSSNCRIIRPMDVYDSDEKIIGRISKCRQNGWFKPSWYQLDIYNQQFKIYEIGLGKEGIKYPVFVNDNQVALLEKSPTIKDNLDEYSIALLDNKQIIPCLIFGIYYDLMNFRNFGEFVKDKTETKYLYTMNKNIKAMYDPNFKSKCIN